MQRFDCDVCLSAGSVNQWGYCEICGEEFEDPESKVAWRNVVSASVAVKDPGQDEMFSTVGQDAA